MFKRWLKRLRELLDAAAEVKHGRKHRRFYLTGFEALEDRINPAWTSITNPLGSMEMAMLLSDGTVILQGGSDTVTKTWYKMTPNAQGSYAGGSFAAIASMNLERLFYTSDVLPSGKVFVLGGEYSGPNGDNNWINSGEIYDPVANNWTNIPNFTQSQFGDDPSEVLPNGKVLVGYLSGPQTYIFDPATSTWTQAGTKLRNDQSDEESWVKLPDGSILSYDVFSSPATGPGHAQRYIPSTNTWVDAGTVPVPLTSSAYGYELGPALLLPNGLVFQIGANNNTVLYNPTTNSWTQGPALPANMGGDDAPAAELPNGHVLLAADSSAPNLFSPPTELFDYDPTANTLTQVSTPAGLTSNLSQNGSYLDSMLVLPDGNVMLVNDTNQLWLYNSGPVGTVAWQPVVTSAVSSGGGVYTLTGTQINGVSEGAAYGDDKAMATNFPIIELTDATGNVSFARTFNWSSTGVATGIVPQTVQFTLPLGLIPNNLSLVTIANGVPSNSISFPSNANALVYAAAPGSATTYTLELDSTGQNLQLIDANNNVLASGPVATTSAVIITGQKGVADTLYIDYSNGNFTVPVYFDGGDLVGGNSLIVKNGTFNTDTYISTGTNSGVIGLDGDLITYANVTTLTNYGTVSNLSFQAPNTNNTLTLQDDGTLGNGLSQLVGTFPTFTFTDPTSSFTLNTVAGLSNSITISGTAPPNDFDAALTINGNANDTVNLNGNLTLGRNQGNTGNLTITAGAVKVNGTADTTGGTVGTIQVSATSLTISGKLNAGSGRAIVQSWWPITLGAVASGTLSVTNAILNQINAGVVQIGSTSTSAVQVNGAVAPSHLNILTLSSSGTISNSSSSGFITVPNLALVSGGSVSLTGPNVVGNLAGVGQITFSDSGTVNVGSVDGLSGLTSSGASITLNVNGLTESQPINVTSAGSVSLLPYGGSGNTVVLGAVSSGNLSLTTAALQAITAGNLIIGSLTANITIAVNGVVAAPATVQNFVLETLGSITESTGGGITAPALAILAEGATQLTGSNNAIATIAGVSGYNGTASVLFALIDGTSLTIGTVFGYSGMTTSASNTGNIFISVAGSGNTLTVAQPVNATTGAINLMAADGISCDNPSLNVFTNGTVTFNADSNADGIGTLTVGAGAQAFGTNLTLRGADMDFGSGASVGFSTPSIPTTSTFFNKQIINSPQAVVFDKNGNLYISNWGDNSITKVTPSGVTSVFVASSKGLSLPSCMAFDANGNLYVANYGNDTVSKATPGGVVTTFVGSSRLSGPYGLAFDSAGNLYVSNEFADTISKVTPSGTVSTFVNSTKGLSGPDSLAFDSQGNLFVTNYYTNAICKVTPSGVVSTFLSNLDSPLGLCIASNGTIYFTNATADSISQATSSGTVTPFVGNISGVFNFYGLTVDKNNNVYFASDYIVGKVTPAGVFQTYVTQGLNGPDGLIFDSAGNLYVANTLDNTISKITPSGAISVVADGSEGLSYPNSFAFDTAGNLYVSNYTGASISEISPAGVVSTFYSSALSFPSGLAFDAAGNLYASDYQNNIVHKITPTGSESDFVGPAGGLSAPEGLAFDQSGNLYIANSGNNTISKVTPGGTVSTFVNGNQGLNMPWGLTIDANGNLYVSNAGNNSVSKISPTGIVGVYIGSGQGLSSPYGLTFDSSGTLYISNNGSFPASISKVVLGGPVTSQVTIASSVPARPVALGGNNNNAVAGINLTSAELADVETTASGSVTFGDVTQTGNITVQAARLATTAGAATNITQSSTGSGSIILADAVGTGPGLDGNGGNVTLNAGTGGIQSQAPPDNVPEVANANNVFLNGGAIGTGSQPLEVGATTLSTNTSATNGNQFINAVGTLSGANMTAGTGTVTLAGSASIQLANTSFYAANLIDNGAVGGVTVSNSQTLQGIGATGALIVQSGGAVGSKSAVSTLTTASLSFLSGSNFNVVLNSPSSYTQLTVPSTGTISLAGAVLNLSGSITPAPGQVFTIIQNNGTQPVSGTFAGLPEGATIPNIFGSSLLGVISYVGGGNSVTLAIGVPSTTNLNLSASKGTSTYGDQVTFTATVSAIVAAAGAPVGQVQFFDTTTGMNLGTAVLQANGASSATASLTTQPGQFQVTAANPDNIQASYSAISFFSGSMANLPGGETVVPKQLTVTGVTATKVYNQTTPAVLNTSQASLVGVLSGDAVTLNTSSASGQFTSQNAGTNIPLTVAGLTLSGAQANDYTLLQPAAFGTITPALLTVTSISANNKVYDHTLSATVTFAGAALQGVFSGDSVALVSTSAVGVFAQRDVGTGIGVTVSGLTLSGPQAGDYTIAQAQLAANITPVPVNVSGLTGINKTYDTTTAAALNGISAVIEGVFTSDSVSFASAVGSFASPNVGVAVPISVTNITLSGPQAADYMAGPYQSSASANITPASLTGVVTKNYDGTTSAALTNSNVALFGIFGTDSVSINPGVTAMFANKDVGNAIPVTYQGLTLGGAQGNDYVVTSLTGTIIPAPLTVAGISANSRTYNRSNAATLNINGASLVGVVSGDQVTLNTSNAAGTFPGPDVGNNLTVTISGLTISGGSIGDYTLTQPVPTQASIMSLPITVTGLTIVNKIYDQTTTATLSTAGATLVGVLSGDNVSLAPGGGTGNFAFKDVGNGIPVTVATLPLTGAQAIDYTISPLSLAGNILPAPLTAVVIKSYDATTQLFIQANSLPLTGLLNGDMVTANANGLTANFPSKDVGNYNVPIPGLTLTGPQAGDYSLTVGGVITPTTLLITNFTAFDKIYDQTTAATINTLTFSGQYPGDSVNITGTASFAGANVGQNITVTLAGLSITGPQASDYALVQSSVTTTANITPAVVTVTGITANNRSYNQTTAATLNMTNAALSGALNGDSVTLNTVNAVGTFPGNNVATNVTVTVTGLTLSGAQANDYALAQPITTTASITKTPLTVTGITAANKTYNRTTTATVNVSNAALSGLFSGDAVTLSFNNPTGTFANRNVGNNIVVTVSGGSISGAQAGDYSLSQPTTTANITPLLLTVNGITANSKVYDSTTAASLNTGSVGMSGVLSGDSVTLNKSGAVGNFISSNVGNNQAVNVTGLTLSGAQAADYALKPVTASANVTPQSLTIAAVTNIKSYDQTTSAAAVPTVSGLEGSDTVTGLAEVYSTSNLGSSLTLSVSAYAINDGNGGNNYSVTTLTNATGAIVVGPFAEFVDTILGSNPIIAGSSFLFSAQATDQYGNPITNYTGTSSVGTTISPSDPLGNFPVAGLLTSGGSGFFSGYLATAGTYTLTTSAAGGPSAPSVTVTVLPNSVAQFQVTALKSVHAGSPMNVTVTALDGYGNIVTGYTGTIQITSTDGRVPVPVSSYTFTTGTGKDNGSHTFSFALDTPGSQTLTAIDTTSTSQSILGTSAPITTTGLQVTSFTPTPTGFTATFNAPINTGDVALYASNLSTTRDVTLIGSHGPIHGSLLFDPSGTSITFNATSSYLLEINGALQPPTVSAVLPDDTYVVTLVSATSSTQNGAGFADSIGNALDGAGNGGHANFTATFTTHYQANQTSVLALPDFARGPDSNTPIKVPNDTAAGIPITLYNAAQVTNVSFTLTYNPALLNVSGALSGAGSAATDPAGHLSLTGNAGGVATFTFSDANPQSGSVVLGDIAAVVPSAAANLYQAKELLQIGNIVINQGAITNAIAADSIHVNAYFGDVSGDGIIDGLDTLTANQVAIGAATGFAAYKLLDPVIIGDVADDLSVDAGDVSAIDLYVVQLHPAQIPVPPGFAVTSPNAADPVLNLIAGSLASAAWTVSIDINDTKPAGSTGLTEAALALTYDPTMLTLSPADITLGNLPNQESGWQLSSVIDQSTGRVGIEIYSLTPMPVNLAGGLVNVAFHLIPGQTVATTPVQLVNELTVSGRQFTTEVSDTQGAMILSPGIDQLQIAMGGINADTHDTVSLISSIADTNTSVNGRQAIGKLITIGAWKVPTPSGASDGNPELPFPQPADVVIFIAPSGTPSPDFGQVFQIGSLPLLNARIHENSPWELALDSILQTESSDMDYPFAFLQTISSASDDAVPETVLFESAIRALELGD